MKDDYTVPYHKLYEMYASEMYSYGMSFNINKETVLDAIHDVFLHIIEKKSNIDLNANAKFYLLISLRNRLFSIKRKEISVQSIDDTENLNFSLIISKLGDIIEDENDKEDLISEIEGILNELTNRQREVIYLRYMQSLSYEEIAEILHITPKATRKLNYRALAQIKERYGDKMLILILLVFHISKQSWQAGELSPHQYEN